MSKLQIEDIGLKVGLEIHQQLGTHKKLFCNCNPVESNEYTTKFSRKLRITKSELGEYDPAALFENIKSKTIIYYSNPQSSCLVEKDEEPPHEVDDDAKSVVLLIASYLNSNIFSEIYVMRKLVIDGSNTSGFQRTMLVSQGGYLNVDNRKVGVQSICLEEDAARLLKDDTNTRLYSLDRLGIPLIEIALEPVSATPSEIKKIALSLGRLLRTTRKVARGIGTIRQDVNVSIKGGEVVEVKGVQQLTQLEKVIEYEAKRQHGLLLISKKIKDKKIDNILNGDIFEITDIFKNTQSKIIKKALENGSIIKAIKIKNFSGLFGFEPYNGIRFGKELGQLVRFFGIGGIFHSDELPNYGINNQDIESIKKLLKINPNDGFLIIAGEKSKIDFAVKSIVNRIEDAKKGIPAETRAATSTGETIFLRPRPGASRMYPETDIPPVIITDEQIKIAKSNLPKSWDESLRGIQETYNLNPQLSEQVFDSQYYDLFEKICSDKRNSPNFVASILCSTITNLERRGLDSSLLKHNEIVGIFELLADKKITKESVEIIFESIMSGTANSIDDVIKNQVIVNVDEFELNRILDDIIKNNSEIIIKQEIRSIGPLMGIAMQNLRGKASGEEINKLLQKKIHYFINNKS